MSRGCYCPVALTHSICIKCSGLTFQRNSQVNVIYLVIQRMHVYMQVITWMVCLNVQRIEDLEILSLPS